MLTMLAPKNKTLSFKHNCGVVYALLGCLITKMHKKIDKSMKTTVRLFYELKSVLDTGPIKEQPPVAEINPGPAISLGAEEQVGPLRCSCCEMVFQATQLRNEGSRFVCFQCDGQTGVEAGTRTDLAIGNSPSGT